MAWAGGNYIPDRVHNEYLQTAAETGIPGAILFFGMWLLIAFIGISVIIKTKEDDRRILVILMLSGLAAFATDSMFSFPTERIEHSLYIILMAGIILGSYLKQNSGESEKQRSLSKLWIGSFLLIAAVNLFMGTKKMSFEKHMYTVKSLEKANRYNEMITEAANGQNIFVTIDPNGYPLESKTGTAYKELKNYDKAIIAFNKALKLNPNSPMIYNNLGTIYTEMNQFEKAIVFYEKALTLAPEFDIVLKNLAVNYFNTANYSACINALNKVDVAGDIYLIDLMNEAKRRQAAEKK
jgi:tetratricopeptide (TPR) repeat protein